MEPLSIRDKETKFIVTSGSGWDMSAYGFKTQDDAENYLEKNNYWLEEPVLSRKLTMKIAYKEE